MVTQPEIERQFRDYILDNGAVPELLQAGRFEDVLSIHRNNFRLNLVQALAANFPAVANLVGEDCFAALAGAFVQTNPPRSPVLSAYGASFADFLDGNEAVSSLPYLGDVARLDWACNEALHARDAAPLTAEEMQAALARDDAVTLRPHPAVRLLELSNTVLQAWQFARNPDGFPDTVEVAECRQFIIVTRPDLTVQALQTDRGTHALMAALADGADLELALRRAWHAAPQFIPEGSLGQLVARGAFASPHPNPED